MPSKTSAMQILTPEYWTKLWDSFSENAVRALIHIGGIVLAYLILRALLLRLIDGLLARYILYRAETAKASEERLARIQTLQGLCRSLVAYLLFVVFGILFIKALGFDILPLVTTASVLGVAIALGAQKLFRDIFCGFFLIVDDLYIVGETVTISGITGVVQEIGMRVTRLVDVNGRLHYISNGDIGTVTNLSRAQIEETIEISVLAETPVEKLIATLNAASDALFASPEHKLKAAPRVQGISGFNATSLTVRITVQAEPRDLLQEQMRLRGALREALLAADIAPAG